MYFSSNESDRKKLKQFLINVILEKREKSWLQAIKDTQILSIGELRELEKDIQDEEIPVPSVNFFNEWKSNSKCKYINHYIKYEKILHYFYQ